MKYCNILFLLTWFGTSLSQEATIIKTIHGLVNQQQQKVNLSNLNTTQYSFHFLLTTIGRNTIFRMLKSLEGQLKPQDFLTIIYDAKDVDNTLKVVQLITKKFPCTAKIIFEDENLGYWGHGIRNKYAQTLEGDFILHCDDDNKYLENAISVIRKICHDTSTLYIFKIKYKDRYIWTEPKIRPVNIDTGSGVIPNKYNKLGQWEYFYGGDTAFYIKLSRKINQNNIVFVDFPIYQFIRNN